MVAIAFVDLFTEDTGYNGSKRFDINLGGGQ